MSATDTTPQAAVQDPSSQSAFRPIADYGMLADCHSAAHVDRGGSIDWLCLPHYDSSAIFARILDPDAGHWSIRPAEPFTSTRRYLPGTLVLETTFTTDSGVVRLTDAMAVPAGQRGHDLGKDAPHEVLRLVEGVSGEVEMLLELAPRPEYGLVRPLFRATPEGGRTFGSCQIAVAAGVPVAVKDATMQAAFTVAEAQRAGQPQNSGLRRDLLHLLEQHVTKEETGLYPAIIATAGMSADAVGRLEAEHRDLHRALLEDGFDRRDYYALASHIEDEEMEMFPIAMLRFDDAEWAATVHAHRTVRAESTTAAR